MASAPVHFPIPPATGLKFAAQESAWLTMLSEGVALSWVCRHPECRFFGMNDQWIDNGNQFRCPRCADEYWPWREFKKGTSIRYLPFQKVLYIAGMDGETWMVPAVWPGSQADSWLLQQAEIYAAQIKVEGDLQRYMEDTVTSIQALCSRTGRPQGFKHYAWNPESENKLSLGRWPRDGEAGWRRLVSNGYWGNVLDEPPAGEDWVAFTQWHDLIQLIGQAVYCRRNLDAPH